MSISNTYTLIETDADLQAFYRLNQDIEWLAFDSEFVGEKRFTTLICLIQAATPNGYFLIDPAKQVNLTPFLKLIEDPRILKISHAGENDYRLLFHEYGTLPKNVFDTQVAAGFLGHGYPVSYSKLVERELSVSLDKRYAVTDWEARPFNKKQLEYAINDVYHLYELYSKLEKKLIKLGRSEWARLETAKMEAASFYLRDPDREALSSTLMYGLKLQKQVFLLRLYRWRKEEAKNKNYSKEMILASKMIAPILRGVDYGKESLLDNRTVPSKIIENHWETFNKLYKNPPTEEETSVLKKLTRPTSEDPRKELSVDLLHLIVKFKCNEEGIATSLVLNKSDISYALPGEDIFENDAGESEWQKEFLGTTLLKWLHERQALSVHIEDEQIFIATADK